MEGIGDAILYTNVENTLERTFDEQENSKKKRYYKENIDNQKETTEILENIMGKESVDKFTLTGHIKGSKSRREQHATNLTSLNK